MAVMVIITIVMFTTYKGTTLKDCLKYLLCGCIKHDGVGVLYHINVYIYIYNIYIYVYLHYMHMHDVIM